MPTLSQTAITNLAVTYQNDLRMLPYIFLEEELKKLGINMMQVIKKDIKTKFRRKGGFLRPYVAGNPVNYIAEVGKFAEAALEVQKCNAPILDHVMNYEEKKILGKPVSGSGKNQSKEHPFEKLIVESIARTISEDMLDALFFAERNVLVQSPAGTFDGYNKHISNAIVSGEIAVLKGNLVNIGAIAAPVDDDDTDAIDKVIEFVRSANLQLKRKPSVLQMTPLTYQYCVDALENRFKFKSYDINGVIAYINEKSQSKVSLAVSDILGAGTRLTLTVPDNYDFGMDTFSDTSFIQARFPFEDPNIIQWWVQCDLGTRITDFDKKVYCISDGTVVAQSYSGDY
jgi:hypothetical protein